MRNLVEWSVVIFVGILGVWVILAQEPQEEPLVGSGDGLVIDLDAIPYTAEGELLCEQDADCFIPMQLPDGRVVFDAGTCNLRRGVCEF